MSSQGGVNQMFAPPGGGGAPQGQPHPTISWGMPPEGGGQSQPIQGFGQPVNGNWQTPTQGGFPTQINNQQVQQPGMQQQFQPVINQPHPSLPWAPVVNQQGMPQFPQQQQFQQPGRVNLDPEMILDGPNVPVELRGRKVREAFGIYSALATNFIQGGGPQQQVQQQPQFQPQFQPQGQQPMGGMVRQPAWQPTPQQGGQQPGGAQRLPAQGQPQQQWGQQQQNDWDWANPGASVRNVIREEIGPMLQPVLQRVGAAGAAEARDVANQTIPDFAYLEPYIVQKLAPIQQANPAALQDPHVWINAARLVRGEMVENNQYDFSRARQVGQNVQGQPVMQFGGGQPNQRVQDQSRLSLGPGWQPMVQASRGFTGQPQQVQPQMNTGAWVPAGSFFTENPTPPMMHEFGAGALTPAELFVATQMNMSPEMYAAWKGGVMR